MHPLQDDGTPAFIMQVDVISATDIELVSVGEDGSTVVWKNSIMHQAIPHPCTLWCVRALPNGDFLTGAHDGVIRIFSTDPRRSEFDSARALQVSFEVEVEEATAKRHKGPSEEDLRKAPRWEESSSRPGTSEGQVCVFNKQGKLIAAQWSSASRAWVEMGEVVGSAGDGELINGVKYDVVLPVEMDTSQGPQNLKLGMSCYLLLIYLMHQ
jgi:phospholipase A-2-activating protein